MSAKKELENISKQKEHDYQVQLWFVVFAVLWLIGDGMAECRFPGCINYTVPIVSLVLSMPIAYVLNKIIKNDKNKT